MDSDWSELPEDLLSQIILKLISSSSSSSSSSALDCVRLGAVCVEWRSFLFRNVKFPIPFPLLLIPPPPPTTTTTTRTTTTTTQEKDDDQNQTTTPTTQEMKMNHNNITTTTTTTTTTVRKIRGSSLYYNLSDRKFYYLESLSSSRLLSHRYLFHGSTSQGWLITLDPYYGFSIRLYNPFNTSSSRSSSIDNNNLIIDIPPPLSASGSDRLVHSDICCWRKMVLSSSPSLHQPNSFVAMLLVEDEGGSGLFTYSAQDKVWNVVLKSQGSFSIDDVIYFRHQFHYVYYSGHLFICDNLHPEQLSGVLAQPTEIMINQESKKYLVESPEGDLLQVQRNYNPMLPKFQVFKLQLMEEKEDKKLYMWVELKTLNGRMLFLSENASMSFSASDLIGYKPNCIYFSDHRTKGSYTYPSREKHPIIPLGVGVFNLEDGSTEQHLPPAAEPPDDTNSTPPIWIQTMLYMSRQ